MFASKVRVLGFLAILGRLAGRDNPGPTLCEPSAAVGRGNPGPTLCEPPAAVAGLEGSRWVDVRLDERSRETGLRLPERPLPLGVLVDDLSRAAGF